MTAADALDAVAAHVPNVLVSPESLARIRETAAHLPAADIAGFEVRLGDPRPLADYAACWVLPARLDGPGFDRSLAPAFPDQPEFAAVREVIDRAARDERGFRAITNVTLEFDESDPQRPFLVPNIYVATDGRNPAALVNEVIPVMRGNPLPPRVAAAVWRCLELAPRGPWVEVNGTRVCKGLFQLGVMAARGRDEVRLCLHLPYESDVISYLRAIGWPGGVGKVSAVLARLAWPAGCWSLAIDVGEQVNERIGFELNLHPRGPRLAMTKRWKQFLDVVLAEGLCVTEKYWALAHWPGEDAHHAPPWGVARFLHHAKIVLWPGCEPEVKVYLAYV